MENDKLAIKIGRYYLRHLRVPCVKNQYKNKDNRELIGLTYSHHKHDDKRHGNRPDYLKGQTRLRPIRSFPEFLKWFTNDGRVKHGDGFATAWFIRFGFLNAKHFMRRHL